MSDPDKEPTKSAATTLVDLALERYSLHVTDAGEAFAVPHDGANHIARRIRGGRLSMRADLARSYFQAHGKTAPAQALADAVLTLEGIAQQQDPEELHLRVAESHGAIWIDVGDTSGTVIKVTNGDWTLTNHAPVLFQRTALTVPMAIPEHSTDFEPLWEFLNVPSDDRVLLLAVLVAALIPKMPHPILTFSGEQGTGKSSAMRSVVDLVDPSAVPLRKPPRDTDSWVVAALGSWLCAIDNVSLIPDWFSDSLCRAVTGDGDVRRQLYSDADLSVFAFRRQVMLTGIDFAGLRGDLAERLVLVELARIPDAYRRDERQLEQEWSAVRPQLLGALLDLLAAVQMLLPKINLPARPRMADFSRVLAAVDTVLGTKGFERYLAQGARVAADTLTSSPFITVLIGAISDFEGTASQLLTEVAHHLGEERTPRDWPKSARAVTSILKRDAPALLKQGWVVDDLGSGGHAKVTRWRIVSPTQPESTTGPEMSRIDTPPPPQTPQGTSGRGFGGDAGNRSELPLAAAIGDLRGSRGAA